MRRIGTRPGPPALLVLLLTACGAPPAPRALLVAEPARRELPRAEIARRAPVAEWPMVLGPAEWTLKGPGQPTPGGLRLRPTAGRCCSLARAVSLDTATIDELALDLGQRWKGRVRLAWAAAGEPFSAAHSLVATAAVPAAEGGARFAWALRGHPGWRGTVGTLRLTVNGGEEGRREIELRRLTAHRWQIDAASLHLAGEDLWRVELGHERRDALVAGPGEPRAWEVGDPAGRRLAFGFGTEVLRAGRVVFRVWTEEAGERVLLWEAAVGEGGLPQDRWHRAELSLPSGRPGPTLLFGAAYEPDLERLDALGFWSNPELVPPADRPDPAGRPDIVLVSIDTLRADRLSLYGHGRPTTPRLEEWAREATVFERVVTSAPWTLPAHLSLFTGLDALHHGVNHRSRVPEGLPLLAERLRAAGYATWAVTGGGYLAPEFGLDRGFERYRTFPERAADEELATNLRAALDWIEEPPPRPFFLFFHTYETHYPYRARQPYFAEFAAGVDPRPYDSLAYVSLPQEPADGFLLAKQWRLERQPLDAGQNEVLGALYDSGVAYADAELAPLLARLAAGDAGRRTVVAVTSDHGETLGEGGLAGHAYLDDGNALVPLVLRLPGGEPAGRVAEQVRLVDLAPTLLELAGIAPAADLDGTSLLPLVRGAATDRRPAWTYAAFSNRGVALRLDDRLEYLWNDTPWAPLAGREALYDSLADPKEETARAGDARLGGLRQEVTAALAEVAGAVRLHFQNGTATPISGRLVGGPVQPTRLKSPLLPPGALRWAGPREAVVEVPPAAAFDLLIENPTGNQLQVNLEPDFAATLDLAELGDGWRALLDAGRWRIAGPGDGTAPTEVFVGWNRTFGGPMVDTGEIDPALREQLEALGYVE